MKFFSLNQLTESSDDFVFRFFDDIETNDAIVIFPEDAMIVTPVLIKSRKTLEEHIEYIQKNNIKKAIIAANDIHFLSHCPSLEYLHIIPSIYANDFDYSPIYQLPNLKLLHCETMYGLGATYEVKEKVKVAHIDYSRFPGLKSLSVIGAKGHQNVNMAESVEVLVFEFGFPPSKTLSGFLPKENLKELSINASSIKSLEGIEVATKLHTLNLSYNRSLVDISHLRYLSESLVRLEIEACGKIQDFSVLSELSNLEFLTLKGSNVLKDISFLKCLPKLRNLHLTMNVEDGDLNLCEQVPYVRIQNRKHYSHKDKDLPKNFTNPNKL